MTHVLKEGRIKVEIVEGVKKVERDKSYIELNKERPRKCFGLDMGQANIKLAFKVEVIKNKKVADIEIKHDSTPSRIDVNCENKFGVTHYINEVPCVISKDSNYSIKHTKNTEHNIFLGYYLISQHIEDGDIVNVGIGLPLDVYKNTTERQRFAESFKNYGQPIVVNDKTFYIDEIKVCPEGVSAMVSHEAERDTLIIDIGGRNVNMVIVDDDCSPIIESIDTLDAGMHKVVADLRSELRSVGEIVTEDNVRYFVSNGCKDEKITETIDNYLKEYMSKIEVAIKRKEGFGFNKLTTDILFVGGTSKQFEKEIMNYFSTNYTVKVSENALWDNVDGYLEFLLDYIER